MFEESLHWAVSGWECRYETSRSITNFAQG